jgi:hypothetical protein
MVWMGVASRTFLAPISTTNARIIEQTKQGVVFQARNPVSPSATEGANAR